MSAISLVQNFVVYLPRVQRLQLLCSTNVRDPESSCDVREMKPNKLEELSRFRRAGLALNTQLMHQDELVMPHAMSTVKLKDGITAATRQRSCAVLS